MIDENLIFCFSQDRYDPVFQARIDACPLLTISDLSNLKNDIKCAQLRYSNNKEYVAIADTLGIMNDLKVISNSNLR